MSNTMLLLAMYPDVQEKVLEELKEVFPDQHCEITTEHLQKLVYLEMVLKESMRFLTVSPTFIRQVTGDVKLSKYLLNLLFDILLNHSSPIQPENWLILGKV
jgi:cytochrome P450 family 313